MQVEPARNFRVVLRNELIRRIKSNPRYSLRSFARHLGISPATLSRVLNGKRNLSMRKAAGLVEHLNLDPSATNRFLDTVAASHFPVNPIPKDKKTDATLDRMQMKQLAQDTFQIIADWYHYAILELTFLNKSKIEPRSIAKVLGCSFVEAKDALERLKRVGLLEERQGKLIKPSQYYTSGTDYPSSALKRHHFQMLQKAKQSLLIDPLPHRDFTSMTMAIDSTKLPEAKKRITQFRRELCAFLEDGVRDRVYELSIMIFPLSREEEQ